MGVGLLEAFELSELVGDKALTVDELLFVSDARKRKGCKNSRSTLTRDDRRQVVALGIKCKNWKGNNHG